MRKLKGGVAKFGRRWQRFTLWAQLSSECGKLREAGLQWHIKLTLSDRVYDFDACECCRGRAERFEGLHRTRDPL